MKGSVVDSRGLGHNQARTQGEGCRGVHMHPPFNLMILFKKFIFA